MYINIYNRNFRNGIVLNHGFGDFGKKEVDNKFLMNPEYPHSQDARDLWWKKLETWGDDPNYGAISPDWDNIWKLTQNRVKEYYQGGPLQPGVKDRLKSATARRGMSDQPASDFLNAQIDAQQGNDLQELDAQQNIARNEFAERGRTNWLTSLDRFQSQRPAGEWQTQINAKNPWLDWGVNTAGNAATAYITGGMSQGAASRANDQLAQTLRGNQTSPQGYSPLWNGSGQNWFDN